MIARNGGAGFGHVEDAFAQDGDQEILEVRAVAPVKMAHGDLSPKVLAGEEVRGGKGQAEDSADDPECERVALGARVTMERPEEQDEESPVEDQADESDERNFAQTQ